MKKQKKASNPNGDLEKYLGIPKYDKPKVEKAKSCDKKGCKSGSR